jgi:hypothetical protein
MHNKLHCFDADFEIYGNWNSDVGSFLYFQLERCDPSKRDDCKGKRAEREYLKDKYLVMAYNQMRFNNGVYGSDSVETEQALEWININLESPIMHRYQITF